MSMLQKMEFARGGVCGGRKTTAVNSDDKTIFFLKTGRRQQLTRQLITSRVQVIASTLPHTLHRNVYMVTTLARSKHLYCNTIARPPARIVVVGGST